MNKPITFEDIWCDDKLWREWADCYCKLLKRDILFYDGPLAECLGQELTQEDSEHEQDIEP